MCPLFCKYIKIFYLYKMKSFTEIYTKISEFLLPINNVGKNLRKYALFTNKYLRKEIIFLSDLDDEITMGLQNATNI